MWRFISFCCRGGSKPAALLEGKWGRVFLFAWCQHLKRLCLDPLMPATAQTEPKTAPRGKQTAGQEAIATPVPWAKAALLHISLPGGLPGSPPAPLLLCPKWGLRADWKEEKWSNFTGVYRELLQWEGKHGRKPEPSSRSPNGTWRSCYQGRFIPTGMLRLSGALHRAAPRQDDVG